MSSNVPAVVAWAPYNRSRPRRPRGAGDEPITREWIMARVAIDPDTGCWDWLPCRKANGYGTAKHAGRAMNAHRAVYLALVGEIAPDLDVDHLCRNRRCVNPEHLEAVTRSVNLRRGRRGGAALPKEACVNGHSLTPDNTYRHPSHGRRICRECARERTRQWRHRNKGTRA